MKRKQRRKLAIKLAKQQIKKLGVPRRRLNYFVSMYMKDMRLFPEKYAEFEEGG